MRVVLNEPMTEQNSPFTDDTMRRLVEIVEQQFVGRSDAGGATATVRGDLSVVGVGVDAQVRPSHAGPLLVEALNRALATARETMRSEMAEVPGLDPQLRGWLRGDEPEPELEGEAARKDVVRDYSAEVDGVVVTFSSARQEFVTVFLPDVSLVGAVRTAANRALEWARLGRSDVPLLQEQIDDRLAKLDEAMDAIESRLDGVEENLDKLLADLE